MPGSGDHLVNPENPRNHIVQQNVQARWEESMLKRLDEIRAVLRQESAEGLAYRCGATLKDEALHLTYWQSPVFITFPELEVKATISGRPCSLFDSILLLYYLSCADGSPLEDRWISFREFPGGAFYHQAFQGYSGDRLAHVFNEKPDAFNLAARQSGGDPLTGISEYAWAFQPLPRIRLAALFWPGDEELTGRGAVLFDASSLHYMVLDGLAILGSRLVSKLEKASDE